MDTTTTILIIGIAANGLIGAALILARPIYAWDGETSRREKLSTT